MIGKFTGIRRAGSIVIESTGAERAREEAPRTLLSLLSSLIVPYSPSPVPLPRHFDACVCVCARRGAIQRFESNRADRSSIPTRSFAHLQPEPAQNQRRQLSAIYQRVGEGEYLSSYLSRYRFHFHRQPSSTISFVRGSQAPPGARGFSAYLICK